MRDFQFIMSIIIEKIGHLRFRAFQTFFFCVCLRFLFAKKKTREIMLSIEATSAFDTRLLVEASFLKNCK